VTPQIKLFCLNCGNRIQVLRSVGAFAYPSPRAKKSPSKLGLFAGLSPEFEAQAQLRLALSVATGGAEG
jgi:hypothetical protein